MDSPRSHSCRAQWSLAFALVLLFQPHTAAGPSELEPGGELPLLDATALSGESTVLPRDARGHGAVLVFGFSKAAAKVTGPWLAGCRSTAAPAGSGVNCFDLRMVEDVPRLFRGSMERGMRSGFPVDLQRQTLLVYTENKAWRERLGAEDGKSAYVVACDRDGRVRGIAAGPFAESKLKLLLEAIAAAPPER